MAPNLPPPRARTRGQGGQREAGVLACSLCLVSLCLPCDTQTLAGKPQGPVTCYFTADDEWDAVWYDNELIATGTTRDITVSAGKRAKTGVAGTAELGSNFNDQNTDTGKYYVAVTVDVVPGAVLAIQAHDGGSGTMGQVAFVMYCKDQSGAAKIGVSPGNTGSTSRFLKASGATAADWHTNNFDDSAWGHVCQASLVFVWACFPCC